MGRHFREVLRPAFIFKKKLERGMLTLSHYRGVLHEAEKRVNIKKNLIHYMKKSFLIQGWMKIV